MPSARSYLDRHSKASSYSSPSMSNPPSPPRLPSEQPNTSTAELQQLTSSSNSTTSQPMPSLAIATPILGPPFYESAHRRSITVPPATESPTATSTSSLFATVQTSSNESGSPLKQQSQPASRLSGSRAGRKSKVHVASACVNCKRAHLSCDVQRPCTRCVTSGKQDTCFDVQHKKRGRPRLREEGEFKVDRIFPEPGPSTGLAVIERDPAARPIATARHRRTESYRSLRSQGSDGSSPIFPLPPPPTATEPTFGLRYSTFPPPESRAFEVPTAYLDLDLVIIRANQSWQQIMLGGQEVAGRHLEEVVRPIEGDTFQNIRARLRAERESREPSYMPPIVQSGQDPLDGASETDVDRYTHGFEDRTYTWTQTQMGLSAQAFPSRVRLAKANAFFVAITLPSFRPVDLPPPQPPPPLFTRRISTTGPRVQIHTPETYMPAPMSAYTPFATAPPLPAATPRTSGHQVTRSYPPPQPPLPYQQQQQQQAQRYPPPYRPPRTETPKLSVAEPPIETTAFTPQIAARQLTGSPAVQLPPIRDSPRPAAGYKTPPPPAPPIAVEARAGPSRTSGDDGVEEVEEEEEDTPKKRQRMDIDDVLHR